MKRALSADKSLVLLVWFSLAAPLAAAEGDRKVLFNGQDFTGWQSTSGDKPSASWVLEEGAMVRKDKGGYVWTKERFGDFVLDLEFRTEGNSGVFFRTGNLRDPVQTGIEVAIDRPAGKPGTHSTGALYDLLAPSKVADKPAGQWNHLVITAKGSRIEIELNGQQVVQADLDQWTEGRKNPDGSLNKFAKALKDFPREGHIGFQDHGAAVAFRNVRIRPL
jgi:hypothetical protein